MARANIFDMIQNQETNGASLVSRDTGAFVKKDKIEEVAKKEFVKAIQAGTLDMKNLDFDKFLESHMADQYVDGKTLLEEVKKFLQVEKKDIVTEDKKEEKDLEVKIDSESKPVETKTLDTPKIESEIKDETKDTKTNTPVSPVSPVIPSINKNTQTNTHKVFGNNPGKK